MLDVAKDYAGKVAETITSPYIAFRATIAKLQAAIVALLVMQALTLLGLGTLALLILQRSA